MIVRADVPEPTSTRRFSGTGRSSLPTLSGALLLGGVVLAMASSTGCRSVLKEGRDAERSNPSFGMPSGDEAVGSSALMSQIQNQNQGSPSLPTDPDPMPNLTPRRATNVHLDLGRVFESRGQLDAAEGEYRKALDSEDRKVDKATRAMAHRKLASVLDRQGKFADSGAHHREATKLAPKDHRVWNDSGYSSYLQGRFDEAITLLREAEKLEPNDKKTLTNLGLALAASGRDDEATAIFSRAGGPSAAEANLAYIQAATGRTDEARGRYETLLSQNPAHPVALKAIGQLDTDAVRSAEMIASTPPTKVDSGVVPASFEAIPSPRVANPPTSAAELLESVPVPVPLVVIEHGLQENEKNQTQPLLLPRLKRKK